MQQQLESVEVNLQCSQHHHHHRRRMQPNRPGINAQGAVDTRAIGTGFFLAFAVQTSSPTNGDNKTVVSHHSAAVFRPREVDRVGEYVHNTDVVLCGMQIDS